MNDDDSIMWVILGVVALFVFYKINQTDAVLTEQQISASTSASQNPWITVPGALSAGIAGVSSIANTFSNLFTDNSGVSDDSGDYGDD